MQLFLLERLVPNDHRRRREVGKRLWRDLAQLDTGRLDRHDVIDRPGEGVQTNGAQRFGDRRTAVAGRNQLDVLAGGTPFDQAACATA